MKQNEDSKIWNIKDAKPGDVLANKNHILILKELDYDWYSNGYPYSVHAYCGIKPNGNFELGKEHWCFCGTLYMRSATEEERNLLFCKMKEAGYVWDADKKELREIKKINEKDMGKNCKLIDAFPYLAEHMNVNQALEDYELNKDSDCGVCESTKREIRTLLNDYAKINGLEWFWWDEEECDVTEILRMFFEWDEAQSSDTPHKYHYHLDYDRKDGCGVKCSSDTNTIEEVLAIIEYQLRNCRDTKKITLTINK